ncbi:MAG: hypothetical protein QNJ46_30545 [Leptolyngbyaceae cyanobacterium MO_188.B28]|nr:hypothetical protein [Leptolyngbyaceae cyanobacterium MO_188.B28]
MPTHLLRRQHQIAFPNRDRAPSETRFLPTPPQAIAVETEKPGLSRPR